LAIAGDGLDWPDAPSPKCDLGEVEKAMFQGLACHFELIFGVLNIPKCELVEVEKGLYLGLT